MKIHNLSTAIHVDKAEGTAVDYFLFPEYEVHYNVVKPGVTQLWHHHTQIAEVLFIIEGELEAHWLDELGQKVMAKVGQGDLIEVQKTPHTFINSSETTVKFVVFRFVPDGKNKSELIKKDKVLDEGFQ